MTKHNWVYPMTNRDKFIEKLRDFVDIKLRRHGAKIRHYHADGGAELISKKVLAILKREGDSGAERHDGAKIPYTGRAHAIDGHSFLSGS